MSSPSTCLIAFLFAPFSSTIIPLGDQIKVGSFLTLHKISLNSLKKRATFSVFSLSQSIHAMQWVISDTGFVTHNVRVIKPFARECRPSMWATTSLNWMFLADLSINNAISAAVWELLKTYVPLPFHLRSLILYM